LSRGPRTPLAPAGAVPALALVLALAGGCGDNAPGVEPVRVGLMLSYSGFLAANSANSERALVMAVEAANAAGGIDGRPLELLARDTRSDPNKVADPARELLDAGVALVIGPDTADLITMLRSVLGERTVLLPSYATAADIEWKPRSWFVMGASTLRVGCELVAQLKNDSRKSPLLIVNPTGYNSQLSWRLTNGYGMPRFVLDQVSTASAVRPITSISADAYVLAAFPASASSLVYALAAIGAIGDPGRWYLSPTLHTPAFLASIPKGLLHGARGVSAGTVAMASDFRAMFMKRWQDQPLDDAYPFYDAGAVSALALQRAITVTGGVPTGNGLAEHILAVTAAGGTPVAWNEIDRGLALLREGQAVQYVGVSGSTAFDLSGQTPAAIASWWTIGDAGFDDVPSTSECRAETP
jgi:ABC-type branched-subunit amino acid transport system substrate-binding protein